MTDNNDTEITRLWRMHKVSTERIKIIACLEKVVTTLESSNLDSTIKEKLSSFYTDIITFFNEHRSQQLANDHEIATGFVQHYITNLDIKLITGFLNTDDPYVISEVNRVLTDLNSDIQTQGVSLLASIKEIGEYAIRPRGDEDFYASDELDYTNGPF